jgi:hypothetical protein
MGMDGFIEVANGLWYEESTGLPWSSKRGWKQLTSKTSRGYRNVAGALWHRIVWEHFYGSVEKGMVIDHFDNNILNNKISNLRMITTGKNVRKANNSKNNTSGYTGVYWRKDVGFWLARLRINGKDIYLGRFDVLEDAYAEYYHAKGELHGVESLGPLDCPIAY